MKAIVLEEKGQPIVYREFDAPELEKGTVRVSIKAAGLNHRDVWITKGMYPGIQTPGILGSDGAGIVDGRAVIINPNIGWGPNEACQDPAYTILGMPAFGTMAEELVVPEDRLADKPEHLSWEEAAALPLGGLTAYRAVFTKGNCKRGDKVLISGIGGGVALFAFQFALAAGADVYVTSGSAEKLSRASEMGAKGGANYRDEDWAKSLAKASGGFDLVIDSAGGPGFASFPKICNYGARIVTYGGTLGKVPGFSPQLIFWKQITILGTSMGSDQEFADMVEFVNKHQIKPVVDEVFPLADAGQAFQKMDEGKQFGKIVLKV